MKEAWKIMLIWDQIQFNVQRELIEQCNDESIRVILSMTDKLVNETKNII